jgi:hypothetical protein
MIWRSHQICKRCGWAGVTQAHRLNMVSGLLYLFAVIVLWALDGFGVLEMKHLMRWPACVVALLWFYGVPLVVWRLNSCGRCRARMAVNLLSGNVALIPGDNHEEKGKGAARAIVVPPRPTPGP